MQTTNGSLTLVNPHSGAPKVFWNGAEIVGVLRVHVHNDSDTQQVKLVVSSYVDKLLCAELVLAGISVKEAK
jgi:hypothetical protein